MLLFFAACGGGRGEPADAGSDGGAADADAWAGDGAADAGDETADAHDHDAGGDGEEAGDGDVMTDVDSDPGRAESCNGQDDNGDGRIDEDFPDLGTPCDGPDSDACANGVTVCSPDGSKTTCGPEQPTDLVELCNGRDDDCDGQLPAAEQDGNGNGLPDCLEPIRGYQCAQGTQGRPPGGGEGYGDWLDPATATAVVADLDALLDALAAAQPGDIIYVADDAEIDLGPRADQQIVIPGGVTLASGRGRAGSAGALLFTDDHDRTSRAATRVFAVTGPAVRITGLRFRGPDTEVGEVYQAPLITGIVTSFPDGHRDWEFEVDNCEFWGWPDAAVSVYRTDRAYIHHNFFHHNRRAGLGYGVVVNYANPTIGANLFQHNRHGIASTGYPTTGYEACHNLVLPGATSTSFDMHGGFDKGFYPDTAGSLIVIHDNTFLAGGVDGIGIRGDPAEHAEFYDNSFVHSPSHVYPSAMWQRYFPKAPDCLNAAGCILDPWDAFPGYFWMRDKDACRSPCEPSAKRRDPAGFVNIDAHDNTYGAAHQPGWFFAHRGRGYWMLRRLSGRPLGEMLLGDFDGDGADDGLDVAGGSWRWYPGLRLDGGVINSSGAARADLAAGDFDGDGRADVFWADGAAWQVSWGGASSWQRLNTSSYRVGSLGICDFDADGRSDVLRADGAGWFVSWGGSSSWQQLNTHTQTLGELQLADVDGDGSCDVFWADGSRWRVAWAGQGAFESINTSGITAVRLADLDGDGRADVVRSSGGVWYVSWAGRSSWQELNRLAEHELDTVFFADVDGNGAADALVWR